MGEFICAAPAPAKPSPAVTIIAIISLDMSFPYGSRTLSQALSNRMPTRIATLQAMLFMLLPLSETALRHHGAGLQAPHQEQNDHDQQHYTNDATGTVPPTAGVRPDGQDADECQDHNNQQNGAKAHDLYPLLFARRMNDGLKSSALL